jgi:hypothetical protein
MNSSHDYQWLCEIMKKHPRQECIWVNDPELDEKRKRTLGLLQQAVAEVSFREVSLASSKLWNF